LSHYWVWIAFCKLVPSCFIWLLQQKAGDGFIQDMREFIGTVVGKELVAVTFQEY